jgi:tricorn protease interacting factor F2/3
VQVRSYDLFIDLDFERLKFKGKISIDLHSEQNVVLNAVDLVILSATGDEEKSFRTYQNGEDLTIETGSFDGTLEIDYEGSVSDRLAGIYRASYDHTYIVTTHFEAAQARRMLPCVDSPDAKAEFKLTVSIDKNLDAISNMPVEAVTPSGTKKRITFQKTPRMSTYLLYLGVGKFEQQTAKLGETDVILATTPGKKGLGKFAQDEAMKAIRFYERYFGIPYALPKIDLIAIPEFAMGAMENWGAITFREVALLLDANSSTRSRKRVSEIVAHELAHQWFGNLVTMKWWDDIWLNESFATFMAYKVIDSIHPEWRVWEDFLRDETAGAMARDCLKNTHPIEVTVKSPDEIEQIFDAISYGKGASILRMIETYIGKQSFEKGIQRYLSAHAYGNATGNDLWMTLSEVSGIQVQDIMTSWIRKPGYPIVTALLRDGRLTLRQERFLISQASEPETWPIPVTMEVNGQIRNILLHNTEEHIEIKNVKSFKINLDRTGFYSVNYVGFGDTVWKSNLSAIDRWGIISDAFTFLLSGKMKYADYVSLLGKFTQEKDYLPTHEVSDQLSFLHTILPSKTSELSRTFHRSQLRIPREKSNENTSILQGTLASRLTLVDNNYAKELAPQFKEFQKVEPDMRQAVALAYARSEGDYDGLLKAYRESNSDEHKVTFLNAMTAFSNESFLNRTLEFALSGEVKKQDVRTVLLAATEKPDAKNTTWSWLKANLEKIRNLYQNTGILSGTFLSIIPILGIGRIPEVEDFFNKHKIIEAEVGIKAGLEKLNTFDRLVRKIQS